VWRTGADERSEDPGPRARKPSPEGGAALERKKNRKTFRAVPERLPKHLIPAILFA